ncbi:hypothetical protein M405DRAFT_767709 [Rhizopogon salebrosus TDB-379]|nr:hypothetical protein M405DRAFT_767709 [Rhizopogon salebrosus TDB-379]
MGDNIQQWRAVLQCCPNRHPDQWLYLSMLAISLCDRFKQEGVLYDLSDLNEAIDLHRAALALCTTGHPNRSDCLNNLAARLCCRSRQEGALSDLDEAIDLNKAALALCPPGHSNRFSILNNYAICLHDRFKQEGVLCDLNEAIDLCQAALALCPTGHPNQSGCLNNLAISLYDRFQQEGALSDLDEAIDLNKAAFALCSPGHPSQSVILSNLANSLYTRFEQRGILSDLDEAIDLDQATLALCPPGHSNQSLILNNYAIHLHVRFEQMGTPSDLDEAIDLYQAALALHPPGHSNQSSSINNLAISLHSRFQQRGVLSDLDDAIDLDQFALVHCPPGHSNQPLCLNNLAVHLYARFNQRGVLSDLDEAIDLDRAALALHPPGHSSRSDSLNNLAIHLYVRFKERGVLSDLDEAIDLDHAALALHPPGHSNRSSSINNLASHIHTRFLQRGVLSDLAEAIDLDQAALALCLPGCSNQSLSLQNLAIHLRTRFQLTGVLSDLDGAIELARAALELCPPGHCNHFISLNILAISLSARFKQHSQSSDLNEAFNIYGQLSQVSHAVSHGDLRAAKSWTTSAEMMKHSSALSAYQTALKLLADWQHVTGLSSSSHHFDVVSKATSSLAMDAFSCGVRHGALETAVELMEQGRAVFWTQLAHFQTPLDAISASGDIGKALAAEFKEVSLHLRAMLESSEDKTSQIGQLTLQRDDVISRIRMLPDFSRFLLPPLFSDLQQAAEDGPVIVVNSSQYGCDAMIILSAQDPVHIPLDIAQANVSELSKKFQSLVRNAGSSDNQLYEIVGVLRTLWECVVGPIVEALQELLVRPGSRIWWCPTAEFTLLPLHAAGLYVNRNSNLSRFYISSYTPTLAALVRARQQVARIAGASTPHFAAIGQGSPYEGAELAHVAAELGDIARRVASVLPFTSLTGGDATVQRALDALSRHQWIHLACHGIPNRRKPFDSSFAMRDGPLTITDIIRPRLQNSEFAFLSACHTTVGYESSPDESIHLAAAMQFSGFRSVIGSMWSVDDKVIGQLVSAFYENMVDGSGKLDCRRAAVALHAAVKELRTKIPLEQQIVLVHIGV